MDALSWVPAVAAAMRRLASALLSAERVFASSSSICRWRMYISSTLRSILCCSVSCAGPTLPGRSASVSGGTTAGECKFTLIELDVTGEQRVH